MSETPMGWYKWYARNFLASTKVRRMSITAQGIYRTLLDVQWEDGSIPTDFGEAMRVIGATEAEGKQFEPFFETCFPGGVNARLDMEREVALRFIQKQRSNGMASAKAKKNTKLGSKSTVVEPPFNQKEKEKEKQKESSLLQKRTVFVKPSVSEVCEYMTSRGFPNPSLHAEKFMAHYEANGWMAGKSRVKKWQACVITFELRMKENGTWAADQPKDAYESVDEGRTEPIEGIDFRIVNGQMKEQDSGAPFDRDAWFARHHAGAQ